MQKLVFLCAFLHATRQLGFHPFVTPSALLSEAYTNPDGIARPACEYCGYCSGFLHGRCKSAAHQYHSTRPATPTWLRVAHDEWARRVVLENGRVTGVQYSDDRGNDFFQPATIVVLASWILNNVRLLLLSNIAPYNAISGEGTLGRNLTHQVQSGTRVFFDKPLNAFMGSGAVCTRISDCDGDRSLTGDEGSLRLGAIQAASQADRPIDTFGIMPRGTVSANWGSEWKAAAINRNDNRRDRFRRRTPAGAKTSWILDPTRPTSSAIHCCASRSIGRR